MFYLIEGWKSLRGEINMYFYSSYLLNQSQVMNLGFEKE